MQPTLLLLNLVYKRNAEVWNVDTGNFVRWFRVQAMAPVQRALSKAIDALGQRGAFAFSGDPQASSLDYGHCASGCGLQ